MVLTGYIDESYNVDVFSLSCLLGRLKQWTGLSSNWKKCLNRWNMKLIAQGRNPLTRYHAKDCSNFKKEFAGWSVEEQRQLTTDLLWIFNEHPLVNMSMSINVNDFRSIFPEAQKRGVSDFIGYIYGIVTKTLLYQIGKDIGGRNRFRLIYDRGPHGSDMMGAFNRAVTDKSFPHAQCFVSFYSRCIRHLCSASRKVIFMARQKRVGAVAVTQPALDYGIVTGIMD